MTTRQKVFYKQTQHERIGRENQPEQQRQKELRLKMAEACKEYQKFLFHLVPSSIVSLSLWITTHVVSTSPFARPTVVTRSWGRENEPAADNGQRYL